MWFEACLDTAVTLQTLSPIYANRSELSAVCYITHSWSLCLLPQEGLIREQAQQHDETYYLWALSFFMAFNRGNGFRADLVSETMSIRAFHFIERNITNYYEMMLTDRKEASSWSRRWVWKTGLFFFKGGTKSFEV